GATAPLGHSPTDTNAHGPLCAGPWLSVLRAVPLRVDDCVRSSVHPRRWSALDRRLHPEPARIGTCRRRAPRVEVSMVLFDFAALFALSLAGAAIAQGEVAVIDKATGCGCCKRHADAQSGCHAPAPGMSAGGSAPFKVYEPGTQKVFAVD